MAEDTKPQTPAKPAEKELTEKSQAEAVTNLPRVTRKIDMNTVEVQFDKKDKGKKFQVLDNGVFKGEGEYTGESETVNVSLTNYLKRGVLHEFSVILV